MREKWNPGHMVRAKRTVRENLQNVDVVVEVRDARLPDSTGNPDLPEILKGKPLVIALNKKDLADPDATQEWLQHFNQQKIPAIAINAFKGHGIRELVALARQAAEERFARLDARGRRERAIRIMVVGIPNVGKSQLINALSKRGSARTGDRPGVTRGKQWIHIDDRFLLLDTPGILWPRQRDPLVQLKLEMIAALDSKVGDPESTVLDFFALLDPRGLQQVRGYFGLDDVLLEPEDLLEAIGRARGMLVTGGIVDREKTAVHILRAFQTGKLGHFSFELPGDAVNHPEEEGDTVEEST